MDKRRPVKSDPDYEMYVKVRKWNVEMTCLPSWDEMLEYEYVRQRGEINMLAGELQRYAFDRGLYALVNWVQRCKDNDYSVWRAYEPGMRLHQETHGPRSTWITNDVTRNFLAREIENEENQLRLKLEELQKSKAKLLKL